ncbi:hypothetical protein [Candidatus Clavichlamydia salmonicola]|uniref:hypothetical protein n=1 Tax=Candidatus Clavichlamydia salmonicola TaxID=469812 RepID=UPI001890E3E0|nr:hypothetical protein [Candidatus Clavichlamydia salmonicola]
MQHFSFGLPEALENLNILGQCPGLSKINISHQGLTVSIGNDIKPLFEEEFALHDSNKSKRVMDSVTSTLKTIQEYFIDNYQNMVHSTDLCKIGMKTVDNIMMEVDTTISSLEHADVLFCNLGSLPEYKNLKQVYQEIQENILGESNNHQIFSDEKGVIFSEKQNISKNTSVCKDAVLQILNNVSDIKKDKHYELFYIKNDKGSRFYSDNVLRSIGKLEKDIRYSGSKDPLVQSKLWEDRDICYASMSILKGMQAFLQTFYKQLSNVRKSSASLSIHNCIVALMLAAKPEHLLEVVSSKNCFKYFLDFLFYLRNSLEQIDFIKDLTFDDEKNLLTEKEYYVLTEILNHFCYCIYTIDIKERGFTHVLKEWSQLVVHQPLSSFIEKSYEKVGEILSKFPNGPLFKSMDLLIENEKSGALEHMRFDPMVLGIFPQKEGILRAGKNILVEIIRAPCPTIQRTIDQVFITEEFLGFLKSLTHRKERCLFVNLQDRLSWKEKTRCHAIESLREQPEYAKMFYPISLPEDVDFVWCTDTYGHYQGIEPFIMAVHDDVLSKDRHYFMHFKEDIWSKKELKNLLFLIAEVFFSKKKNLSRYEKVLFLNIFYYLAVLRIIHHLDISKIIISSKDALDGAGAFLASFMAFIKLNKGQDNLLLKDADSIFQLLTGSVLTTRDRCVFAPLAEMLIRLVEMLEKKGPNYLNQFSSFIGKSEWKFQ